MAKKGGLGKGLDSLIPDFYNEDFDSNSAISLEDMLGDEEIQGDDKDEKETSSKNNDEEIIKSVDSEENNEEDAEEEINLTDKEKENIEEVKRWRIH